MALLGTVWKMALCLMAVMTVTTAQKEVSDTVYDIICSKGLDNYMADFNGRVAVKAFRDYAGRINCEAYAEGEINRCENPARFIPYKHKLPAYFCNTIEVVSPLSPGLNFSCDAEGKVLPRVEFRSVTLHREFNPDHCRVELPDIEGFCGEQSMGHRALTGSFYCVPTSPLLIKEQLKAKKGLVKPPEGYTTHAIPYDPNVAFPTVQTIAPISSSAKSTRSGDGGPLSLPTWVLIGLLFLLTLAHPQYRRMIFIVGLVMIAGSFVGAAASEACIFDSQCSDDLRNSGLLVESSCVNFHCTNSLNLLGWMALTVVLFLLTWCCCVCCISCVCKCFCDLGDF